MPLDPLRDRTTPTLTGASPVDVDATTSTAATTTATVTGATPATPPVDVVPALPPLAPATFLDVKGRTGMRVDAGGIGAGGTLRLRGVGLKTASPFVSAELLKGANPKIAVGQWIGAQAAHDPAVAKVIHDVTALLGTDARPRFVKDLFTAARDFAKSALAGRPMDDAVRADLEVLVATIGIAAQVLPGGPGGDSMHFPPWMPTGRPNSFDFDAAWHLSTSCLFTTLAVFDAEHGDGSLSAGLDHVADLMDHDGKAHEVKDAYDRVRGELRPLHPDVLDDFPDVAFHGWYFPRPDGLTDVEGHAWDQAVRTGDAYEHSDEGASDYAGVVEGGHDWKPDERFDSTLWMFSGVKDPGVCVDITANRVGAWLAIAMMRDPSVMPDVPFDTAAVQSIRPLEPPRKVAFENYYAGESVQLALLSAATSGALNTPDGGRASPNRAAHAAWATSVGPQAALDELKAKAKVLVDKLASSGDPADREALAKYYASFAVRHLAWRSSLGGGGLENPSWDAHHGYGQRAPADVLTWELGLRFDAIAKLF